MKIKELFETENQEWEIPFSFYCTSKKTNLNKFEEALETSYGKPVDISMTDLDRSEVSNGYNKEASGELVVVAKTEEDAMEKARAIIHPAEQFADMDEYGIRIDGAYKK